MSGRKSNSPNRLGCSLWRGTAIAPLMGAKPTLKGSMMEAERVDLLLDARPWMHRAFSAPARRSRATYTRVAHFDAKTRPGFDRVLQNSHAKAQSPPASPAEYTVKKGDTLSSIIRNHLAGRGQRPTGAEIYRHVGNVARQNGIKNPNLIYPGQQLDLSPLDGRAAPPPQAPADSAPASLPAEPPRSTGDSHQTAKGAGAVAGAAAVSGLRVARGELNTPASVSARRMRKALEAQGGPAALQAAAPTASLADPVKRDATSLAERVRQILRRKSQPAEASFRGALDSPWRLTLRSPARLSSEFGIRKDPFTGRPAFHEGIDLAAKQGTPVYAFRPGEVTYSGWKAGYGNVVIVRHEDGLESVYGHNSANLVEKGARVTPDKPLAEVGSTGRSTGPHLHFEVRRDGQPVDPVPYLTEPLETG